MSLLTEPLKKTFSLWKLFGVIGTEMKIRFCVHAMLVANNKACAGTSEVQLASLPLQTNIMGTKAWLPSPQMTW
jgi:hypothetical protein